MRRFSPGSLFYITMVLYLALSCTPMLKHPPAPAQFSVIGLWVDDSAVEGTDQYRILQIAPPEKENEQPSFVYLTINFLDRPVGGKSLFLIRRDGFVRTSRSEVLLIQRVFYSSTRTNEEKLPLEVWPIKKFGDEILERKVESAIPYDILDLSADGMKLTGYKTFRRIAAPGFLARGGVVLRREAASVMIASLDNGILKHRGDLETTAFAGSSPVTGHIKILDCIEFLCQGEVSKGEVSVLNAVLPTGGQASLTRELTREEIMQRLKRGEEVPRDQLMRYLEKNR